MELGFYRVALSLFPAFMMKAMPIWKSWVNCFHRVRGMIFHTRFEMNLGQRLYGLTENQTHLFGEGLIPRSIPIRKDFAKSFA